MKRLLCAFARLSTLQKRQKEHKAFGPNSFRANSHVHRELPLVGGISLTNLTGTAAGARGGTLRDRPNSNDGARRYPGRSWAEVLATLRQERIDGLLDDPGSVLWEENADGETVRMGDNFGNFRPFARDSPLREAKFVAFAASCSLRNVASRVNRSLQSGMAARALWSIAIAASKELACRVDHTRKTHASAAAGSSMIASDASAKHSDH
mmetsp:Transcript_20155/g.55790  ORF Transcript_20155/g.55790 Transcript_20155/m.55790 type:complete len:209 (-) Transcript_20155:479-1105(-)